MNKAIFYDVSPLIEFHFTGIANVTAALAKALLDYDRADVHFIIGCNVIAREAVRDAVNLRSGATFRYLIETGSAISGFTRVVEKKYDLTVALFTNIKTISGVFNYEILVVHDITYIITPEFHSNETIRNYGLTVLRDLASSNFVFADSDCTRHDLISYLGLDEAKVSTAYPGVDTDAGYETKVNLVGLQKKLPTPYIVVPGTIEPRKNIRFLLRYLSENRPFLQSYCLLFFGRSGWLVSFNEMISEFKLREAAQEGRILWLEYVPDGIRDIIYRNAEFMVFPSLYEGFGLPVGEAMAQGCPVCASFSSSIPEVGGDAAVYFDPLNHKSLHEALTLMQARLRDDRTTVREKSTTQAKQFSWTNFTRAVLSKAEQYLEI